MAIAFGVATSDYEEYLGAAIQQDIDQGVQQIVDRVAGQFETIEEFRKHVESAVEQGGASDLDSFLAGDFLSGKRVAITGKSIESDLVKSYWTFIEFPLSKDEIAHLRQSDEFDDLLSEELDELRVDAWDKDLRFALTRFVIEEETPRYHESSPV